MAVNRRIALYVPTKNDRFIFPIEGGEHDAHSHFFHAAKYSNGGFTGERCLLHRAGPHVGRHVWFRLEDHEHRLEQTIQAVEWLKVVPRDERIQARFRLAALNRDDCYFSLFFGSEGDVGVYPKSNEAMVLINSRDMDPFAKPYLPIEVVRHGMNVMAVTDPDLHRGPAGRFARAKLNVNYLLSNIAKHRAIQAGFHDALVLDERGRVSELSVSNVFLVEDGRLVIPAYSSALDGITKRTIIALAAECRQLPTHEEVVTLERLSRARAVFATGTAVGIVKINRVVRDDGREIYTAADSAATELVEQLSQLYWRLLYGEESGIHPEWFTPVPDEILAQPEPLVRTE